MSELKRYIIVISALLFLMLIGWTFCFTYNHPHMPITLSNAATCQAYEVKSLNDLKLEWIMSNSGNPVSSMMNNANMLPLEPMTHEQVEKILANRLRSMPTQSLPDFNSPKFGKKLSAKFWITQGPFQCKKNTLEEINKLLSSLTTYHKIDKIKSRFVPNYAFKISNSTEEVVILIDIDSSWVNIKKNDANGKLLADSGVIQANSEWIRLLHISMSMDTKIDARWKEIHRNIQLYPPGLKDRIRDWLLL